MNVCVPVPFLTRLTMPPLKSRMAPLVVLNVNEFDPVTSRMSCEVESTATGKPNSEC